MIHIFYNDVDVFSGICSTPFVGRDVNIIRYGDRHVEQETFKMNGLITGHDCSGYSGLIIKQEELISGFRQDWKSFEIFDDSTNTTIFSRPTVEVKDLSFSQSDYSYAIPFSLTLSCYPSGYFSGVYGILEPKNEFSYSESKDEILTLNHSVGARGFNTNSSNNNALTNAQNWVNTQTGLSSIVLPAFIAYTNQDFCLTTLSEQVNRLTATYEVKETYTTDLTQIGFGILRYTVEYSYEMQSGKSSVKVSGDIIGCKNGTLEQLRERYNNFNPFIEAQKLYYKVTGNTNLNPLWITRGVSEDPQRIKLSFSYEFDDSLETPTYFEYTVKFDYDMVTDVVSANIAGTVASRLSLEDRWGAITSMANSIDLYSLLLSVYQPYAASLGITYPMNPAVLEKSRTDNEFTEEISLSARFSNAIIPAYGFVEEDISIDINPSLRQYSFSPCLNGTGSYVVLDLGYTTRQKGSFSISSIAAPFFSADAAMASLKAQIPALFNSYLGGDNPSMESQTIKQGNSAFGLQQSVSAIYTSEGPIFSLT